MNYWLDLFTGTTWDEFRRAGSTITGFRERMRGLASEVKPGDILLCYLAGVQHWIGALEVIGPTKDRSPIWKEQEFPVRFEVRPLLELDAQYGVPMKELEGRTDFYSSSEQKGKYKGFVRRSPNRFQRPEDGALVLELLRQAEQNPQAKEVDPKQYARRPLYKAEVRKGKATVAAVVSVPEPEEHQGDDPCREPTSAEIPTSTTKHTEIQYHLLRLGADMGLDVWVAKNDRGRIWND